MSWQMCTTSIDTTLVWYGYANVRQCDKLCIKSKETPHVMIIVSLCFKCDMEIVFFFFCFSCLEINRHMLHYYVRFIIMITKCSSNSKTCIYYYLLWILITYDIWCIVWLHVSGFFLPWKAYRQKTESGMNTYNMSYYDAYEYQYTMQ